MPKVIHFEMHAQTPERAIQFYQAVFGWSFSKWPGPMDYWLITTGPASERGIDGGLIRRQGPIDGQAVIAYVCTIDVPLVDDTVTTVELNGGTNVVPKMPVPGVGWLAYCKDTEGNIFGVMQADERAQ